MNSELSLNERRERIVRVMIDIWDSLQSHLEFTHTEIQPPCDNCGDKEFQVQTVKDYARNLKDLADLL